MKFDAATGETLIGTMLKSGGTYIDLDDEAENFAVYARVMVFPARRVFYLLLAVLSQFYLPRLFCVREIPKAISRTLYL